MPRNTVESASLIGRATFAVLESLESRRLLAFSVAAEVETDPVHHTGDASDDMAFWVHPTDPSRSLVVGTDCTSAGGLALYDMSGNELQFLPLGDTNNVDIRDNFSLNGQSVSLIAASLADDRAIALFTIDPATRRLSEVGRFQTGLARAYGLAMYHSAQSGKYYALANDANGVVEQYELRASGSTVSGALVRRFDVGGSVEGMVADDALGRLYVSEEYIGNLWRYGAEPSAGTARTLVDSDAGSITPDVEGLTIYDAGNGQGYLIASSQGANDYIIYERGGSNDYITRFRLTGSGSVDSVTDADGIDVISRNLGPNFPKGVFAAQDGDNLGENLNFKLVGWDDIVAASDVPLLIAGQSAPPQPPLSGGSPTPTIRVNFQPASAATPSGYLADTGGGFAQRGAYAYGWNTVNSNARDRNAPASADQRYDTFNHMQLHGNRKWEVAVPNGSYQVRLVAGDANFFDSNYRIDVEGVRAINAAPTSSRRWIEGAVTVNVTDGRISVTNGSEALNNKINFIEIAPASANPTPPPPSSNAPIRVNFQPLGAATPANYLADVGASFGNRGAYFYGWNSTNSQARDRNSSLSPNQAYDTLTHMQMYGDHRWEIALPNGTYDVTVVAGDAAFFNSVYRINVEATRVVNGTPTSSQRWIEGTATVAVTDGRLTLSNASGAVNNKISYVEIVQS